MRLHGAAIRVCRLSTNSQSSEFAKKPHQSQAAHRNRYAEAATAHRTESTSKIIYSSIRGDVVSDKVMTYDDIISAYFYPFRPRRTQTIHRHSTVDR